MKKVLLILSAPEMYGFMRGQPGRLYALGYNPTVVAAASEQLDRLSSADGCRRIVLPMTRHISPWSDVVSFVRLISLLRKEAPSVVIFSGPKALFLGGLAAWLAEVPTRIAVYHGMRQERMFGPLRHLLDTCDRISFATCTKALAVSKSLARLVVARGLTSSGSISVTGPGTANGINPARFSLTVDVQSRAKKLATAIGIQPGDPVIGFVGRLTEDKGIADIWTVYHAVRKVYPKTKLLLVGPEEVLTRELSELVKQMRTDTGVIFTGSVEDVEAHMALFTCFLFPSIREGFPMAITEAASLGVPTVGYAATGVVDAIVNDETGFYVQIGDCAALVERVIKYLGDSELRIRHGEAASRRACSQFSPDSVWRGYVEALKD
jgi:glycosyltransferase involved in cell wall biosynthesis